MHHTLIKICGIRDIATACAAADTGAHWIGLVFVAKSPRFVTPQQALAIVDALPRSVEPVGLFVDAHADQIRTTSQTAGIQTVQLHGHEPISILDALQDLRVIKALPYAEDLVAKSGPWQTSPVTQALLIDTPSTGELTGGSGVAFNWQELAGKMGQFGKPVILAGGLTPENVGEAIRVVRPYAVDVSSGVESSRGVKDVGLIKAFCEAVRQADRDLE